MSNRPMKMKLISFLIPDNSKDRLRNIGILIVAVFILAAILAPVIAPYDPDTKTGEPFEPPGNRHLLGCNDVGYDLLSEMLYGARLSLLIGLLAAVISTAVATIVALLAGYLRGWVDTLLMRVVDIVMALPFLPLAIVIGVYMGGGITSLIIVISLVMWAHSARELRSQVLSIRESGHVEAARAMGSSSVSVMVRHILPEISTIIVPQFVRIAQHAILVESSLSFLGLGDPIHKSWGGILFFANTRAAFLTGAWSYWVLPPGICIALVVLGLTFIGFSLGGGTGLTYYPFGSFVLRKRVEPSQ